MDFNVYQAIALEYVLLILGLYLGLKCFYLKKDYMNYFFCFIVVLDVFLAVNVPIRYVELHAVSWNKNFVFWLYAVSVIAMTLTMFTWLIYVAKSVNGIFARSRKAILLTAVPILLVALLCILNYNTGWLYYIDENGWYHRGSVFILQSAVSYVYFAITIISNIYHVLTDTSKEISRKCFVAIMPAFIMAILQFIGGGSYLLSGVTIGALIMYIEICLDRQKAYEMSEAVGSAHEELSYYNDQILSNMQTILALSDIYYLIYEADFVSDTYKEIKSNETSEKYCKNYTSAKECLENLPQAMFKKEDLEENKDLFTVSGLKSRLKNSDNYYVEARSLISNDWIRTNVIVSERDEEGEVKRAIISMQNVDETRRLQKDNAGNEDYEALAESTKETLLQTLKAIAGVIDSESEKTKGHSVRVATRAKRIARRAHLSEEECEKVFYAGLLHDIGNLKLPKNSTEKNEADNGNNHENDAMHVIYGKQLLDKLSRLPYLSIAALYHHEKYDGSGFPERLEGEDIPRIARILAVSEACDEMEMSGRYDGDGIKAELKERAGTDFDPEYANIMLEVLEDEL